MTDDTPPVLYVSIDRSGLSPVPVASFHKHMGAEEWGPKEQLDALADVLRQVAFRLGAARQVGSLNTGWHDLEREVRAALAALPAPDEGEQDEVEGE